MGSHVWARTASPAKAYWSKILLLGSVVLFTVTEDAPVLPRTAAPSDSLLFVHLINLHLHLRYMLHAVCMCVET